MSPDWYSTFARELADAGIPPHGANGMSESSRAEAAAAGCSPNDLYGPAVLYARELAAAYRTETSTAAPQSLGEVLLRLADVHVHRGRRSVLRGVSLQVRAGEVVAVALLQRLAAVRGRLSPIFATEPM